MYSRNSRLALLIGLILVVTMFAPLMSAPAIAGDTAVEGIEVMPRPAQDYMRYIQVNNFRFDPLAETPDIPSFLSYDGKSVGDICYHIVQFKGPITPDMKTSLESTGVTILYYVNYNAFVVKASANALDQARSLASVRWAGAFEPAYKLSPRLSESYDEIVKNALEKMQGFDDSCGETVLTARDGAPAKAVRMEADSQTSLATSKAYDQAAGASGRAKETSQPSRSYDYVLRTTGSRITVDISTFETARIPEVLKAVYGLGGTNIQYSHYVGGIVRVEIDREAVADLAQEVGVMWIDRFVQPQTFNDIGRWVIQSGDSISYSTPIHDHGIWGTGQTVTLGDTGIDYQHDAFEDPSNPTPGSAHRKVTDYYIPPNAIGDSTDNGWNHGTHTSGTIGGDDGAWHVYDGDPTGSNGTVGPHDGEAFDAKIQMQDLSPEGYGIYPPPDMHDMWQPAVDRDSWIHSNSWGQPYTPGYYIDEAAQTDDFIWNNQEFIVVFAAGNSGPSLGIINPFSVAKNCISVGATLNGNDMDNVADFSSRGPAVDGRLKPDVMAPGVGVWSAEGGDPEGQTDTYKQGDGTSMATPMVAASAALTRQYFMDGWYPTGTKEIANAFTPSAALVKAILINGAVEISGDGAYESGEYRYPNNNQGWGRILLDNGLYFQGDHRGLVVYDERAGIDTDMTLTYQLAIGDVSMPVEITLVWSDYPGVANTYPNLVNDLDLVVTAPDGTYYHGNIYQGYDPGESIPNPGDSNASSDHLNNVESVLVITDLQAGLWTIEVSGCNVPMGPQPYALVMTGGVATQKGVVQMDHPRYQSSATVNIRVVDTDLNIDPDVPDVASVSMSSTTESDPEVITLTETAEATCVFAGSIPLGNNAVPVPGDGILQVQNMDTITAAYYDEDDGLGGAGWTYDTAVVDDDPPSISSVGVTNIRFNRATILWTTDESSDSVVYYENTTPPSGVKSDPRKTTSHSITLFRLDENTTYYFAIESTDEAGNTAYDNNSTMYYWFNTTARPPTAPPDIEWPTFHNNPQRTGVSPSVFEPPLELVWSAGPNYGSEFAGPIMSDGILFSQTADGAIRARDAFTGDLLWTRHLAMSGIFTGTPTVDNGMVYGTFPTMSGPYIYALDEYTGETVWATGPEKGMYYNEWTFMAAADGLVFGTAWSGEIFALDAFDGSVVWTYQASSAPLGGTTIGTSVLYIGTEDGEMLALDEFGGGLIWTQYLDNTIFISPLYALGNVYVGTFGGTMYCLDATTGDIVWQVPGLSLMDSSTPSCDGSSIYFSTESNGFYALDAADGSILWNTPCSDDTYGSVAYANGYVFGVGGDGVLYSMDASDGSVLDSDSLGNYSITSVAVSEGWVWADGSDGTVFAFLGRLPVGLSISPAHQSREVVPSSVVDYNVNVTNLGFSGSDTFDATVTLGALGWTTELYESDGITRLHDSDSDDIPDTGSLLPYSSVHIIVRVTIPSDAAAGDMETAMVTFTSNKSAAIFKVTKVTSTVPPPGVSIGPRQYFELNPGDSATLRMEVGNTGAFNDTIDVTTSSKIGWPVTLLQGDGATPLVDTDSDTVPDTGLLPGLDSTEIVVVVQVPSDAEYGTVEVTDVVGVSSRDPNASGSGTVVIELAGEPSIEWPTFHQNNARTGISPVPYELPLSSYPVWDYESWNTMAQQGPIISEGNVYFTDWSGSMYSLKSGTGQLNWQKYLGSSGCQPGPPTAAYDSIYVAFTRDYGTSVTLYCLDEDTGSVQWSYDSVGWGSWTYARTSPIAMAGMVFWTDYSGGMVYANDAFNGSLIWSKAMPGIGWATEGPTYWAGMLFCVDDRGTVIALDAFTGEEIWSVNFGTGFQSAPAVLGDKLLVGDTLGTLHALDPFTGEQIWMDSGLGPWLYMCTPTYGDGLIFLATPYYSGMGYGMLWALDAETGSIVWSYATYEAFQSSAVYVNGVVIAADYYGYVYAWNAVTGGLLQQILLGYGVYPTSVAIGDGMLVVGHSWGTVSAYSFAGGLKLGSIEITPAEKDVTVATAAVFEAKAYDQYGNPMSDVDFTWNSVGGLGTVIPLAGSGELVAYVAGGTVGIDTLRATADGHMANATVNIIAGAADHAVVSPAIAEVAAGESLQFSATAVDKFGNEIPGAAFTWQVTGGIGTVDSGGLFTAGTSPGAGTVIATSGIGSGMAVVEVVPGALAELVATPDPLTIDCGDTMLLEAQGFDSYGNEIPDLSYDWTNDIGTLMVVSLEKGTALFSAPETPGSGELTVTAGGMTTIVPVTVEPGPLHIIAVTPDPIELAAGSTLSVHATPMDIYGNEITGLNVVWTASSALGSISQSGVLTASDTVGSGIVTASIGSVSKSVMAKVVSGPMASLTLNPSPLMAPAGSVITLTAEARDEYGNLIEDVGVTWTTTRGTISALSLEGTAALYLVPTLAGSATITATAGSMSEVVSVTVTPGAMDRLVVSPTAISLKAGGSASLTVSAVDVYGNEVSVSLFSWTTTIGSVTPAADGSTASFEAGHKDGSGTITVTASGKSASVAVSVGAGTQSFGETMSQPSSIALLAAVIVLAIIALLLFMRNQQLAKQAAEGEKGAGLEELEEVPTEKEPPKDELL